MFKVRLFPPVKNDVCWMIYVSAAGFIIQANEMTRVSELIRKHGAFVAEYSTELNDVSDVESFHANGSSGRAIWVLRNAWYSGLWFQMFTFFERHIFG